MITRKIDIELELTPEEIAQAFCSMSQFEQAVFFNSVAKNVASWAYPISVQLQFLRECPKLSSEGREIMRQIGEYGEP